MNPERWRQIERLYHAALECEPKDRGKFLADACGDDIELRSELESLLAQAKTTEAFLEKPAIEFAAPMLVGDHGRFVIEVSYPISPNARRLQHIPCCAHKLCFAEMTSSKLKPDGQILLAEAFRAS